MNFIASRKAENILEVELALKPCYPWTSSDFTVKCENYLPKPMSIDAFAKCLLKGEMMAFLPKLQTKTGQAF